MPPARTRIAPSPTGDPHVGTAYQSLFCYALARQSGGQFILRLEDTDQGRYSPDSDKRIFAAIKWCGLQYDEGPDVGGPHAPYRQSERLPIYLEHAERLIAEGQAYYCFCTRERLAQMRKEQEARKEPTHYDRHCRNLPPADSQARVDAGETHVVRLKVPLDGVTSFNDVARGEIVFENRVLDDAVLLKSDGFPVYHLAVVVDDHLMEITHVTRGEEWISSTPLHILLYRAFGWEPPVFAHTPLLLNNDRSKISKRKSPEKTSLEGFKVNGYLPEALLNFLALLGWSHPEGQEVFTLEEFVREFSLERILKAGSIFDLTKLQWLNGVYIRALSLEDLAARLEPYTRYPPDKVLEVLPLLHDRLKLLSEFDDLAAFFFEEPTYDLALFPTKQFTRPELRAHLQALRAWLAAQPWPWEHDPWEAGLRAQAETLGFRKAGDLFMLLRIAVTGRKETPPLFDTMQALGEPATFRRLDAALAALSAED
jgi:glutamyl-tRNA synthetase